MIEQLPHRFGRFLLFDRIGQGGMAEIYLGRQATALGGGKLYAVKLILPQYTERKELAEMLIAEAKLAATLTHGNIVQVTDLGREQDRLFIAMEYVDGLDLSTLLKRCSKEKVPLPPELALHMVCELCAALDYASKKKVIHRDVSPSNVLISFDGEVKLCDFGIARAFEASGDAEDGVVMGKAGYMSPEQAHADELDGRSDVFGAGIILWELLAGRKLYKGGDLIAQARAAEIPDLTSRGLPDETTLFSVVKKALARDNGERWATAAELRKALLDYATKANLTANPLRFGEWLSTHFGAELIAQRKSREAAARSLEPSPEPPRIAYKTEETPAPSSDDAPESLSPVDVSPSSKLPKVDPAPSSSPWVFIGLGAVLMGVVAWLLTR